MAGNRLGLAAALISSTFAASCSDQAAMAGRSATVSTSNMAVQDLPAAREKRMTAYLTGYSYWDNTPPGSTAISKPVVHRRAGGAGTYDDPVTIAVGHVIEGGRQTLDYEPGTRFYIERLRKYAIVEDVCGDGLRPQDGPCHTGYKGHPWLDLYIGGAKQGAKEATDCAYRITALQTIVVNPHPEYPVVAGEVTDGGCKVF